MGTVVELETRFEVRRWTKTDIWFPDPHPADAARQQRGSKRLARAIHTKETELPVIRGIN